MWEKGSPIAAAELGLEHAFVRRAKAEAPVIYLVHGRGGSLASMSAFQRVLSEKAHCFRVQAPHCDKNGGYSWWLPDSSKPGERWKVEAKDSAGRLCYFMQQAPEYYDLIPSAKIAIGFSQGAVVAALVIQLEPELLSGAALISGFVLPAEESAGSLSARVFVCHGLGDKIIPFEQLEHSLSVLKDRGCPVQIVTEPAMGHKIGTAGMKALRGWLDSILGNVV